MPKDTLSTPTCVLSSLFRGGAKLILLQPSFAEFHILYNVENITTLRPDILAEFPLLAAWREKMNARKGINAYLVSGRQNTMRNGSASGQKAIC